MPFDICLGYLVMVLDLKIFGLRLQDMILICFELAYGLKRVLMLGSMKQILCKLDYVIFIFKF